MSALGGTCLLWVGHACSSSQRARYLGGVASGRCRALGQGGANLDADACSDRDPVFRGAPSAAARSSSGHHSCTYCVGPAVLHNAPGVAAARSAAPLNLSQLSTWRSSAVVAYAPSPVVGARWSFIQNPAARPCSLSLAALARFCSRSAARSPIAIGSPTWRLAVLTLDRCG
ncbi:hypothetical protein T492DRAFT_426532 [Pavlovales sp. CCMP2436]|nr:hypothetical protein T492DRAFT_426532 [Pavlovales sp. CCMP2436]